MGIWKQIATYLYLRKKDEDTPNSSWVKYMHGINRLSLLLFLFALVVIIIRLFLMMFTSEMYFTLIKSLAMKKDSQEVLKQTTSGTPNKAVSNVAVPEATIAASATDNNS